MSSIFISYRREDAEGQAGRLYDELAAEFGSDSVFMDVAALQPGQDFRKALDRSLASCSAFLSVIGKNWLTAQDASGQRRLDDSSDFVRVETAAALKRDIPVIPVLVQGASTPRSDQLPEDLKDLAYRNAMELTHPRWDSDVQLLIKALRPYLSNTSTSQPAAAETNRQSSGTSSPELSSIQTRRSAVKSAALIAIILAATVSLLFYFLPARKIAVPDLQGKMLEPARDVLQAEHLVLGSAEQREDPGATPGSIVAQSVKAGEHVPPGTPIDVTVAVAPAKAAGGLANSPVQALSKFVPPKKMAIPNSKEKPGEGTGVEGTGHPLPAANSAPLSQADRDASMLQEYLQLSAHKKPLEQQTNRFHFTLSVNVPETTLADISRVHYDLVYAPNPLSLEGGPAPHFNASYDGWGCYTDVVVTVDLNLPAASQLKKTFDMCSVMGQ